MIKKLPDLYNSKLKPTLKTFCNEFHVEACHEYSINNITDSEGVGSCAAGIISTNSKRHICLIQNVVRLQSVALHRGTAQCSLLLHCDTNQQRKAWKMSLLVSQLFL